MSASSSSRPPLRVLRVVGVATVQDGGRPGYAGEGVPAGGARVPEALAAANAAVGNPAGAAGIELFGDIALAWGEETFSPTASPRVRYVAVRGGLDVPVVLGGRGTLAVAGLGGHGGRPLRAGDTIAVGGDGGRRPDAQGGGAEDARGEARDGAAFAVAEAPAPTAPLRVVVGPDAGRFRPEAWAALLGAPWTVALATDRVGTRLLGPPLPRRDDDRALSAPMARGAVQVPEDGTPVLLGPDHPTTGGYPVLAVVIGADRGALGALVPGDAVRFSAVSVAEARAARRGT